MQETPLAKWLYFANVKSSSSFKEKRLRRRAQKHAFEDYQERAEGTLYRSGLFLSTSETSLLLLPTRPRGCPRVQEVWKAQKRSPKRTGMP